MDEHAEHRIAPSVRGWLESPASDAFATDCLLVSGWAFAAGSRIVEIWTTGLGSRRPLRLGLRRDDVARTYPDEPSASHSGFTGYLEFDSGPAATLPLEVWAALDDGRSIRLFRRRLVTVAAGREVSRMEFAARQAIQHPRILLSPRAWLNALTLLMQARSSQQTQTQRATAVAIRDESMTRDSLGRFLKDRSSLVFTAASTPAVSVIVVVWNRADLTLACLRSLIDHTDVPAEIIVVDNASTDETSELLARINGVQVVTNSSNLGFTVSANVGARLARGEFLLFLNNDATLARGSLAHLLDTARRSGSIGAVGGKLVFPDGRLQEAGAIIWADGSCEAYGRGADPAAPEYNFERSVDFCSGALLLTRRGLFEQLGGFDERYRPAYYEDADYCVRLWARGYSVVYQPEAVAVHSEFGSAASREAGIELQRARRPIFVSCHARWLSRQLSRADGALTARSHPHGRPSVVFIDDAVPNPRMGAGFPRAAALLEALEQLGYLITIYVTDEGQPSAANFPRAEVVPGGPGGLRTFLASRRDHRAVIVSRPHNMQFVKAAVGSDLSALRVPCVYDAEAIYALRDIGRRNLIGPPMAEAEQRASIEAERSLTRGCAAVLTVSEPERQMFAAAGIQNVFVVGHAVEPRPTPTSFDPRRSILFVGAFTPDSPNEDAVLFFCRDVLPILRGRDRSDAPIVVAGARIPGHLPSLFGPTVAWRRDVDDLTPLYDDARVFVAPMRYSAGIPLKVVEAAARGVPIVCTSLVARLLGWEPGNELLTADGPADFARAVASVYADHELWQRLREGALARAAKDYSPAVFRSALTDALRKSLADGSGSARGRAS